MSIPYSKVMPSLEGYLRPKTIEEAISLFGQYGKEAKVFAGGTDLLNLLRSQVFMPKYVIDITRIAELDYIRYDEVDGLRIGARATLSAVGLSKTVNAKYQLLHEAIHQMGSTQVRKMGTVVGNLCRASPSADTAPPLLVLEAVVKIVGSAETRTLPLREFFTGTGETILKDYEILTEIQVPDLPAGTGTAFLKVTRVAIDLAKVNVASVLTVRNGVCKDARIALGAVAPTPIRARKAEEVLRGKKLESKVIEEAAEVAAGETEAIGDIRCSADYRKELSKVLVRRAIKISLERTGGKAGG